MVLTRLLLEKKKMKRMCLSGSLELLYDYGLCVLLCCGRCIGLVVFMLGVK